MTNQTQNESSPEPGDDPINGDNSPSQSNAQTEPKPGALEALKNAVFSRYVSTMAMSLMGMWIRITAMGYLVYEITEDPFLLGLIGVIQGAPQLVFAPIAGAYLDRVDRRKVLIAVQITILSNMLFLTWLVATERVNFAWLALIAVIVGICASFDWPARLSILPTLVTRRELPSAVAINAAAFNAARVVGPALSGWLIAGLGMAASFFVSGVATVPFLLVLFTLAATIPTAPPKARTLEKPLASVIAGYKYIWRHVEIRMLIMNDLFPIIIGMSYTAMTPAIASDVLGLGPEGLGLLMTSAGIGSLAGTLSVTRLNNLPKRGRIVLWGLAFFAVMIITYGLSSNYLLSIVAIAFVGLGYGIGATMNDTLIQLNVEEEYRGRVMAAYSSIWGLSPAGGLLAGALANVIGLQWAVALNGLIVLLYVVYLWIWSPMKHID